MTGEGDAKSLSEQRYSRFAERYVTSSSHARGEDLERLVQLARPRADWVVLDVATGAGHTALRFAPLVARVVATDLTARMLEAATDLIAERGAVNVTFRRADAEDLPFEDGAFDLVTCRIAPHHFPDCQRFIREGSRVLRPGGLLLVQDLLRPRDEAVARCVEAFEKLRDPSHHRTYTDTEWEQMFVEAGLRVERTERITKRHELLPWALRQGCTPGVIDQLVRLVELGGGGLAGWMQPRDLGTPQASFVNHHLIIAGRKA